jgi:hypothetical protein
MTAPGRNVVKLLLMYAFAVALAIALAVLPHRFWRWVFIDGDQR